MGANRGKRVLQSAPLPVRPAFKRRFLDFERGIRMGKLEPHERITQIVKFHLRRRHGQDFIIDKWGRGVYWQWICWIVRADRDSKPLSSGYSFGCAKFFVSLDRDEHELHAGLQIERAPVHRGRGPVKDVCVADDWDYHRLVKGLRKNAPLAKELSRLIGKEGFTATAGPFSEMTEFCGRRWAGAAGVRRALREIPDDEWGGFQLYYPTPEKELDAMRGSEIVATVMAVFDEVTPAMNLVMQEAYLAAPP